MKTKRVCTFETCEKYAHARGLCNTHWMQMHRKGRLSEPRQFKYDCSVEGCDQPHRNYGYCALHGIRFYTHGDPLYEPSVVKDGRTKEPLYQTWVGMKSRCYSVSAGNYAIYGGRGIKVCDRWLGKDGYANFVSDMGEKPTTKHSIDRIDVNGDYEPSNCRWATFSEQNINKRPRGQSKVKGVVPIKDKGYSWRVNVTINGKRIYLGRFKTLAEAEMAGVSAQSFVNALS